LDLDHYLYDPRDLSLACLLTALSHTLCNEPSPPLLTDFVTSYLSLSLDALPLAYTKLFLKAIGTQQ
jgi:hypothetical protein